MKVSYEWNEPEKIILRYQYVGEWKWDELYPVIDAAWRELEQLTHSIYVIHDLTQSTAIPYNTVAQFSKLNRITHPKVVLAVIVTPNTLIWSLYRIFSNVYFTTSQKFVVCKTVGEAFTIIQQAQG